MCFFLYVQCCSCTRTSKTKILTTRAPPSWIRLSLTLWRHTVKYHILNMVCDCWFPCFCVYWSLVKARKIVWESHVIDWSSITQSEALWVWRCDVTTSNSIQDSGALVVNILVFDLCVQLQHCTYQRKTLLFALIKVSTFICEREISGLSSPLMLTQLECASDRKDSQMLLHSVQSSLVNAATEHAWVKNVVTHLIWAGIFYHLKPLG